jgi:hypothetical protein
MGVEVAVEEEGEGEVMAELQPHPAKACKAGSSLEKTEQTVKIHQESYGKKTLPSLGSGIRISQVFCLMRGCSQSRLGASCFG